MESEHLVEMAMRLYRRDASVLDELARLGKRAHRRSVDELAVEGPSGMLCGFLLGGDPVTHAVQLGFFFAGLYWPQVFPGLIEKVVTAWRRYEKEAITPTGSSPGRERFAP